MRIIADMSDPNQDEARHQLFTRAMIFHLRKPLESKADSFSNPFDLSMEVGTKAMKLDRVLLFAIRSLQSFSSSLANGLRFS